ncbi:ankyrin repeat domain-containing protein [Amphritea balenae]|uniref:Ankyrin repeat domain-containing protein n=1 Tax=Amphritea balenae TaxID=452629 RepID=A0A3P1SM74_9GAMM|nr:ankyrin repeat domain-containing protein [Amphritea balenae]RRC98049.1 ankyrin repeat domain-containing protein [Amphritea balenae]
MNKILFFVTFLFLSSCASEVNVESIAKKIIDGEIGNADEFVKEGGRVGLRTSFGVSMLFVSSVAGNEELVEYLLSQNADVNGVNNDGASPLYAAVQLGRLKIVQLLLSANARVNINIKGHAHPTPLHLAVINHFYEIAELLVIAGADVNIVNRDGYTALDLAIKEKAPDYLVSLMRDR